MATTASGTLRRRVTTVLTPLLLAALIGGTTYLFAWSFGDERVAQMWASATIADDGSARIHEVIDYDFGGNFRHGIFRVIPGVDLSAPVEVFSPDAPDGFSVTGADTVHIRVGDPQETLTGRHRYVLDYTLTSGGRDSGLAWDAVGSGWDVPIDHVEVQVVAPTELSDVRCLRGVLYGGSEPCDIEQSEPGHLVATADGLAPRKRMTVFALAGPPLDGVPVLSDPSEAPDGLGPLGLAGIAGAVALLAALGATGWVRRAARDAAPTGVPWVAAPGQRIARAQLAAAARPSATLPDAVTPSQGGVLYDDRVLDRHRAAWLLERAEAGEVALEQGGSTRSPTTSLVRVQPGSGAARGLLDRAFQGRERLTLGLPDREFARSWTELGQSLTTWRRTSALWEKAAPRRAARTRAVGVVVGLAGFVLAVVGAMQFAGRSGSGLVVTGIGALLAGAGLLTAVRATSLRTLSEKGSAAWLQVESLRQFLARAGEAEIDTIPPEHRSAYAPWAVALGHADRWSRLTASTAAAARIPGTAGDLSPADGWGYAAFGPALPAFCSHTAGWMTSTAANSGSSDYGGSSFDGGGGGGGGDGGGDGGGGGSW